MRIADDVKTLRQCAELLGIGLCYHALKLTTNLVDHDEGVIEHRISQLLARHVLRRLDLQVETTGLERVDGLRRYCVLANHTSYLDWAVLLGYFPSPLRFIAKQELLSVPVIGSYLRGRAVVIDRGRGKDALSAIRNAAGDGQPWPILLFPEGTRSWTGELQPLKAGGVRALAEAGLTMVPVGIWGTFEALPRTARLVRTGGKVRLAVAEPLDPADYPDLGDLLAELHARIAATR